MYRASNIANPAMFRFRSDVALVAPELKRVFNLRGGQWLEEGSMPWLITA